MLRGILLVVTAVVMLVSVLTTVGGADIANDDQYHSPFDGYEKIVPGAPSSVLDPFGCNFISLAPYALDQSLYCQIRPENGPIRIIGIVLHDDKIDRVSYTFDNVVFGDLVQLWNRPDKIRYRARAYVACWNEGIIATLASPSTFTLRATVRYVTVFNEATILTLPENTQMTLQEYLCTPRF